VPEPVSLGPAQNEVVERERKPPKNNVNRERKIQLALNELVDHVDTTEKIIKLFKEGKRVPKKAVSNRASVQDQLVTDYLRNKYR
jgi:hypothetical protein